MSTIQLYITFFGITVPALLLLWKILEFVFETAADVSRLNQGVGNKTLGSINTNSSTDWKDSYEFKEAAGFYKAGNPYHE